MKQKRSTIIIKTGCDPIKHSSSKVQSSIDVRKDIVSRLMAHSQLVASNKKPTSTTSPEKSHLINTKVYDWHYEPSKLILNEQYISKSTDAFPNTVDFFNEHVTSTTSPTPTDYDKKNSSIDITPLLPVNDITSFKQDFNTNENSISDTIDWFNLSNVLTDSTLYNVGSIQDTLSDTSNIITQDINENYQASFNTNSLTNTLNINNVNNNGGDSISLHPSVTIKWTGSQNEVATNYANDLYVSDFVSL